MRVFFQSLLLIAVVFGSVIFAHAEYPEQNINYIVPFSPGGESDISARIQQKHFQRLFGKELIIQYKPGAGGAVGWSSLNHYPSDGYTIMGTNLPHIVLKPMQSGSGFALEDLQNVFFFHFTPDALVVPADSPYKTLADFVSDAQKMPGGVTVAGSGSYANNHVAKTIFDAKAGITTTYIPFKSTADATLAVLGKQVKAHWGYTTVGVAQGEKVRLLAIAANERHPLFPDVPTFKEAGYDYIGGAYRGLAVPKATPQEVSRKVSSMLAKLNQDPQFREQMVAAGFSMIDVPYEKISDFLTMAEKDYFDAAKKLGLIKE